METDGKNENTVMEIGGNLMLILENQDVGVLHV